MWALAQSANVIELLRFSASRTHQVGGFEEKLLAVDDHASRFGIVDEARRPEAHSPQAALVAISHDPKPGPIAVTDLQPQVPVDAVITLVGQGPHFRCGQRFGIVSRPSKVRRSSVLP
jgi:hypothetical protein